MSNKCRAYSESKLGLEPPDNRKAFYAGWDAALRAALAEPVQEPVAWIYADPDKFGVKFLEWREDAFGYEGEWIKTPLYTAPPQRKPLTHGEIREMFFAELRALPPYPSAIEELPERFARSIERAHGIGGQDESA